MPPARLVSRLRGFLASHDTAVLALPALALLTLHTLTNGQYGFHRDELATLDDARHLAWGFVAYPPLTPFLGRMALELFGPSLTGVRFFAALAQAVVVVIAGLMARELGGGRTAQMVAALATAIAPVSIAAGALFQYVSFDYLWWVLAAWFLILLLNRRDARWWVGVGAAVGMGMMTKYSMLFFVAGIAGGILLTEGRRYLASRWLWIGAAAALALFLPNAIWQARHGFISLDFLRDIHARDIRIGRTAGFLTDQFWVTANPITLPLWIAGLVSVFAAPRQKWHRALGWMFAIPFAMFLAAQGRGYYVAPAYPILFAAGAVWGESRFSRLSVRSKRLLSGAAYAALAAGGGVIAALVLPIAPVNSAWWRVSIGVNGDLKEEIGWPELVETVAHIRDSLPPPERSKLGILAGNYGEAGAIDLYGGRYGLPTAISGINSYWLRGYGDPPPETLIVLGFSRPRLESMFESCELAGHTWNRYGVKNEETARHPDIFVCRRLRRPWPEFWRGFRSFG
jgi:4-amino-4-deoxy-L-arabinose transferase-like glycosyltransferase